MSKETMSAEELLAQAPVHYKRFRFNGTTRYTSIESGKQTIEQETIVIVQSYFSDAGEYRLIPRYKLGYINLDGSMGLKLALQPGDATTHEAIVPSIPLRATFPNPASPNTKELGGLSNAYDIPAHGAVEMWSTRPWTRERCWRYSGFWGWPIGRPVEQDNAIKKFLDGETALFVDGWGHQIENHLIRTMSYSKMEDDKPVALFVRSSELEAVKIDESENEFENFYD